MKHRKLTSLLCSSMLSLTGSTALAQQTAQDPNATPGSVAPGAGSSASQATTGAASAQGLSGASSTELHSQALGASTANPASVNTESSVRLSQIINNSVRSQDGKTLGFVRDLLVEPQSGTIQFAILSLMSGGGVTDTSISARETVPSSRSSNPAGTALPAGSTIAGKLVPVPWRLFSKTQSSILQSPQAGAQLSTLASPSLTLNVEESKLRTAPSFDSSNWTELQGGQLAQQANTHFGVDQSAMGTVGSSYSGQGTSGTSGLTPRQSNESAHPASSGSTEKIPDRK